MAHFQSARQRYWPGTRARAARVRDELRACWSERFLLFLERHTGISANALREFAFGDCNEIPYHRIEYVLESAKTYATTATALKSVCEAALTGSADTRQEEYITVACGDGRGWIAGGQLVSLRNGDSIVSTPLTQDGSNRSATIRPIQFPGAQYVVKAAAADGAHAALAVSRSRLATDCVLQCYDLSLSVGLLWALALPHVAEKLEVILDGKGCKFIVVRAGGHWSIVVDASSGLALGDGGRCNPSTMAEAPARSFPQIKFTTPPAPINDSCVLFDGATNWPRGVFSLSGVRGATGISVEKGVSVTVQYTIGGPLRHSAPETSFDQSRVSCMSGLAGQGGPLVLCGTRAGFAVLGIADGDSLTTDCYRVSHGVKSVLLTESAGEYTAYLVSFAEVMSSWRIPRDCTLETPFQLHVFHGLRAQMLYPSPLREGRTLLIPVYAYGDARCVEPSTAVMLPLFPTFDCVTLKLSTSRATSTATAGVTAGRLRINCSILSLKAVRGVFEGPLKGVGGDVVAVDCGSVKGQDGRVVANVRQHSVEIQAAELLERPRALRYSVPWGSVLRLDFKCNKSNHRLYYDCGVVSRGLSFCGFKVTMDLTSNRTERVARAVGATVASFPTRVILAIMKTSRCDIRTIIMMARVCGGWRRSVIAAAASCEYWSSRFASELQVASWVEPFRLARARGQVGSHCLEWALQPLWTASLYSPCGAVRCEAFQSLLKIWKSLGGRASNADDEGWVDAAVYIYP